MRRGWPRVLGLAAVLGAARPAHAADAAEARLAQALFDEARALMAAKNYAAACPKLAESQRLDPGAGTLLNLAVCHEEEGRLATASAEYREVIAISTRDNRSDRRIVAEQHLRAVEPQVPKLAVTVAPRVQALEGLEVKLDGLELRAAAWGVAAPVDPGIHVVTASGTTHPAWTITVPVGRAENRVVEVDFPAPPPPVPGAWPVGAEVPPPRELPEAPVAPSSTKHNPVHTVMLVGSVAGYAGFAVFGLLSLAANTKVKDGCIEERSYCFDPDAKDAAAKTKTFGWASAISLGVGVIGTIGTVAVPIRVSSGSTSAKLGVGPGSVALEGSF